MRPPTDIQNSTTLWEALDVTVMDETLKMHHDIIRRLLAQHDGYESATGGWLAESWWLAWC